MLKKSRRGDRHRCVRTSPAAPVARIAGRYSAIASPYDPGWSNFDSVVGFGGRYGMTVKRVIGRSQCTTTSSTRLLLRTGIVRPGGGSTHPTAAEAGYARSTFIREQKTFRSNTGGSARLSREDWLARVSPGRGGPTGKPPPRAGREGPVKPIQCGGRGGLARALTTTCVLRQSPLRRARGAGACSD